ncbi:GDP-mannose 4,6-dehydratase [Candidatus Aerophobetes bacterium]|uniref:GDP-mannose 4,6-dehydratase n=1 Tax=Aerophobetes bacterium TaxID=2030807 RepID=A0A2A4X5K9_UNCAE|nr:MAG: GDP-mannose 4,6-dehydratase [Candidatus Aerophobetes bacterium]
MKKALVSGITGQDGSFLAQLLLDQGYRVVGIVRRSSVSTLERLKEIENHPSLELVEGEVSDATCIHSIVKEHQPDEVYNLAAQSHVGTSFSQPEFTFQVDTLGVLNFLEALRKFAPKAKFYQASTSEMFGFNYEEKEGKKFQRESTALKPQSPYGVAKLAAHELVRIYRESYALFACSGILFNHESERRGENFVTRKITKWMGKFAAWCLNSDVPSFDALSFTKDDICFGDLHFAKLRLGNLAARRDWGYAKDYVKAMWMMLQAPKAEDFVVATGKTYSIREFLTAAFNKIGVESWENLVVIDPKFFRPAEVDYLLGDPSKIGEKLGWKPEVEFSELVDIMVKHDLPKNMDQKLFLAKNLV